MPRSRRQVPADAWHKVTIPPTLNARLNAHRHSRLQSHISRTENGVFYSARYFADTWHKKFSLIGVLTSQFISFMNLVEIKFTFVYWRIQKFVKERALVLQGKKKRFI